MLEWLGLGTMNGALLWGSLFVAAPILIHLLSRRKFRVLDWAAIDFLLEADRKNRRRVRLEHLILLLLRCAAVVLISVLVARLFVRPTGLAAKAVDAPRTERFVLLDDSPSMEVRRGAKTELDEAKAGLIEFLRQTAQTHAGDTLTLFVTSQPNRPVLSGQVLSNETIDGIARAVDALPQSDRSAAYDVSLSAIEQILASPRPQLNRTLTVLTDQLARDWLPATEKEAAEKTNSDKGPLGVLRRLAERIDAVNVVNLGGEKLPNLAVADVAMREKAAIVDVPTRFEIGIRNFSDATADNATLVAAAGEMPPVRASLDPIEPGTKAVAPLTLTFREPESVRLKFELPPDALPRDNVRYAAARVQKGIPVLIVDGEPSPDFGQNESFFLERALSPPGDTTSGFLLETVSESQFEGMALEPYRAIFLANVYRISEDRAESLERWVNAGGGLVISLGDQVDASSYNGRLFSAGKGLMPLELAAPAGDEAERRWVHLSPSAANHPILSIFEGSENPFLTRCKFFRWWTGAIPKDETAAGRTRVLAAFTDPETSPAMVERKFGEGRVLLLTSSIDAEWNDWPSNESYLIAVQEAAQYMARPARDESALVVGTPIRAELDASVYAAEVQVEPPAGGSTSLQGTPSEDGRTVRLEYEDTAAAGFYKLILRRHDGAPESLLFAANLDPTEGDLRPADPTELRRRLGESKVEWLAGREYLSRTATGGQSDLWRQILILLVVTLCLEQSLAWWFGRKYDFTLQK